MEVLFPGMILAGLLLALSLAAEAKPGKFPLPGEWPSPRGNGTLDAHSEAKGTITKPKIVWRQFVGAVDTTLEVSHGSGSSTVKVPLADLTGGEIPALSSRWDCLPPEGDLQGKRQPVSHDLYTTYADVLPDTPGLEKIEFESGFAKPTVNGQWQNGVGRLFAWKDGKWEQVWQTDTIDMTFHPMPIVGNFDADGKLEIAVLPWFELRIYDALTGKLKDRCRFTDGRSYGFLGVYDLDGDGKSEFVVLADFAKHADVIAYRDGKLKLLWRKEMELGFDNPQKIFRVNPNPVADVDGDGKLEILMCTFNYMTAGKWRIAALDGITGATKATIVGEYLNGVLDVDGDGVAELLTTHATGRGVPDFGTISVRKLKGRKLPALWQHSDAAWQMCDPPLKMNVSSGATLANRTALCRQVNREGMAVIRKRVKDGSDGVELALVRWQDGGFTTLTAVSGPRLTATAVDGKGNLLVRSITAPDGSAKVTVTGGKARALISRSRGTPNSAAVVVWEKGASRPTIAVSGPVEQEEIVLFNPPKSDGAPVKLRRIAGRGQCSDWPNVGAPVFADLFGDGRRQLIYAAQAPNGCGRIIASDLAGKQLWSHDFPDIPGAPPVWNVGGVTFWQVGHFTDPARQDVLVAVRRMVMHSDETYLLSGRDGHVIWHRDHEIMGRGVGGMAFAIADYDGDGLDDAASFYPSIFYILRGTTGADIIAQDMLWPGRLPTSVYWGIPIAGDFERVGKPSLFFGTASRSMIGLIRVNGELAWYDAVDLGPRCMPAIGDFDGDGRIEAIAPGFGENSEIRCYDAAAGKLKWRMPPPSGSWVFGTASADINSDGRDEALLVYDKLLCCIASDAAGTTGSILWQIDLPTQVGSPCIADIDSSGAAAILLVGSDGYVYAIQ